MESGVCNKNIERADMLDEVHIRKIDQGFGFGEMK